MISSHIRFVAAAALALGSSAAYAQSGNGSDVSGPAQVPVTFAPLGTPNAGSGFAGPSPSTPGAVSSVQASFGSGAPVTSPATGQPIAPSAVQAVSQLINSGSPASLASVAAALNGAGAPSGAVAELTQAIAMLSAAKGESTPAAVLSAAKAFNALVASASASFLKNPPPAFLAIHAALVPMAASIGH